MTTFQKLKHEARRAEQRSDWARAIDLYQQALDADDDMADLSLYNRIGDLYLRLGRNEAAVESYEHAVERYAENDMHTSAIALCNKILRIAPGRALTYRRLGALHAKTGLVAEGRSSVLAYVKQVLQEGREMDAASAVDEFFELTGDEEARIRFADQLAEHGHESSAADQLRRVYRLRAGRGDDATGLREWIEELDPAGVSVEAPASSAGAGVGREANPGAPVNLADLVASRLENEGGVPSFDARPTPPVPPEAAGADGLDGVRRKLVGFREQMDDVLQTADLSVRYDLGVELMTIGLLEEAIREFQTAVTDTRLVEAASARIGECLALRNSDVSFDGIRGASRHVAVGAEADVPVGPIDGRNTDGAGGSDAAAEPEATAAPEVGAEPEATAAPEVGAEPDATAAPEVGVEPDATAAPDIAGAAAAAAPSQTLEKDEAALPDDGEDELQGQFFRARLAQYRIRRAEERHMTDHAAHLDLGAAYIEMDLHHEALRELCVALDGPRPVSGRAVRMLGRMALGTETPPELAIEVVERLAAAGAGPAAESLGTRISSAWPAEHPMRERLVELRSRLWSGVDELPALEDLFPGMGDVEVDGEELVAEAAEAGQPVSETQTSAADGIEVSPDELEVVSGESPLAAEGTEDVADEPEVVPGEPVVPDEPDEDAVERALSRADELIGAGEVERAAERLHASFVRLEEARRTAEALVVLERLLELQPDDATLHHQHTELALMTNDRERLISAQAGLGSCLRRLGAEKRARTAYGRILDMDPSNAVARQAIAEIDGAELERERDREQDGDQARSVDDAEASLTEEEAAEVAALIKGLAGSEDGTEDAAESIERVSDEEPEDSTARSRFELGLAFRQMGMWDEAARELRPALNGVEERLTVLEALGECLVKAGRQAEAIDLLRSNLRAEEDADQVAPLYFLGLALQMEGEEADAREVLTRVEAAHPGYRDAGERLSELSL